MKYKKYILVNNIKVFIFKSETLLNLSKLDIITLVTTMDMDPENMLISIESDLGRALSGKRAGDIVKVNAPGDNYTIEIIEIMDAIFRSIERNNKHISLAY